MLRENIHGHVTTRSPLFPTNCMCWGQRLRSHSHQLACVMVHIMCKLVYFVVRVVQFFVTIHGSVYIFFFPFWMLKLNYTHLHSRDVVFWRSLAGHWHLWLIFFWVSSLSHFDWEGNASRAQLSIHWKQAGKNTLIQNRHNMSLGYLKVCLFANFNPFSKVPF